MRQPEDGLPRDRVAEVCTDFGQWIEDKASLAKTRMRDLQPRFVDDDIAQENQVEVDRSRGTSIRTRSTKLQFDSLQLVQQRTRIQGRRAHGSGIQEERFLFESVPLGNGLDDCGHGQIGEEARETIDGDGEVGAAIAEVAAKGDRGAT